MVSQQDKEFANYLVDLMQVIGPVTVKSMFGGFGFFLEGLMFGLLADRTLYLKVDDDSIDDFIDLGLQPFSYVKAGKSFNMSYHQAPEEAIENIEQMGEWCNKAYGAALRSAAAKSKKARIKKQAPKK